MRQMLDGIFARYGMDGILTSAAGSRAVKLFFHPVNSRSLQNTRRRFSPLGEVPGGQYLGIFPADSAVTAGEKITVDSGNYTVSRVEQMLDAGGTVYYWCLCVGEGDGDNWAQSELSR